MIKRVKKADRAGFEPVKMMRVHRGAVIALLQERPECFRDVCASDEFKDVKEFIAALEASPHEYFINGTLRAKTEEEEKNA